MKKNDPASKDWVNLQLEKSLKNYATLANFEDFKKEQAKNLKKLEEIPEEVAGVKKDIKWIIVIGSAFLLAVGTLLASFLSPWISSLAG